LVNSCHIFKLTSELLMVSYSSKRNFKVFSIVTSNLTSLQLPANFFHPYLNIAVQLNTNVHKVKTANLMEIKIISVIAINKTTIFL